MELNLIRILGVDNAEAFLTAIPWLTIAIITVLVLFGVGALAYRVRFWWKEGRKLVSTPGYFSPRAPLFARIARLTISKLFCLRYMGPVKQIGSQFMKEDRRLIILINHQTERDAMLIPSTVRLRVVRALMAVTQIFGIRVPIAAWLGVIAVHHDKNPAAALRGMIKVLQADEDSDAIVFPQGTLIPDNALKREDFFDGAIMIARKTADKSKRKVAVLPAAIAYDRNPAHATLMHRLADAIGWKSFRTFYGDTIYGAAIAFGKPIPVEELPEDYKDAMTVVFERIVDLSAQAYTALQRPADKAVAASRTAG